MNSKDRDKDQTPNESDVELDKGEIQKEPFGEGDESASDRDLPCGPLILFGGFHPEQCLRLQLMGRSLLFGL